MSAHHLVGKGIGLSALKLVESFTVSQSALDLETICYTRDVNASNWILKYKPVLNTRDRDITIITHYLLLWDNYPLFEYWWNSIKPTLTSDCLELAVKEDRLLFIKLILKSMNCFTYSLEIKSVKVASFLLNSGKCPLVCDHQLIDFAGTINLQLVEWLWNKGFRPSKACILNAVCMDHLDIVKFLISKRAPITQSSLRCASFSSDISIIKCLIEDAGLEIDAFCIDAILYRDDDELIEYIT